MITMIRMKSTGLRAATVAAIVASLLACAEKKEKVRDERVPVTVAVAEQRDIPVQVRVIGSVQPISSVAVRALVAGQLQRVWFREGDDVRKGQLLFTIDQRPYQATLAQAEANLARDQAQAKNADAEATRYAGLVKKDYVTREEYDKFVSGAEAARAVVAADRAAAENARLQLAYCEIRSPLDGRTGSLQVQAGNLVKANDTTPLVTINQITPVYVTFSVPESQLGEVRARGLGNVPVSASPQKGGAVQNGKLTFVDNSVDAQTGTITLKATFTNEGRVLWPGEFVNVAMTLSDRHNATVVPLQAVQNGQKGQYVYVVTAGDGIQMRPVTIVQQVDNQAVIGNGGVNPGDTVVTDGQIRLTPKSKVDVKKSL
jgi:multidrug efflux system membrane fusion protein